MLWQFQFPRDDPYIFRLASSPSGEVFGQTSRELAKMSGDKAEKIEINSKNFMGYGAAMEFGPTGQVAVSSSLCDVARLDPNKPEDVWLLSKDGKRKLPTPPQQNNHGN